MAKATAKTVVTKQPVSSFVKTIEDPKRQEDCKAIIDIMQKATGLEPVMWGPAIIGFGSYHYVYESGHEGDAPLVAFSPRKSEFALYIANFDGKDDLLEKFGKYKRAKACVYIKKIEDIKTDILKKMTVEAVKFIRKKYK